MSVMTGEVFGDICRWLWGPHPITQAAKFLGLSRRQVAAIMASESKVMPRRRHALLEIVRQHIDVGLAYEREFGDGPVSHETKLLTSEKSRSPFANFRP